jgi:hypothetical protein
VEHERLPLQLRSLKKVEQAFSLLVLVQVSKILKKIPSHNPAPNSSRSFHNRKNP